MDKKVLRGSALEALSITIKLVLSFIFLGLGFLIGYLSISQSLFYLLLYVPWSFIVVWIISYYENKGDESP